MDTLCARAHFIVLGWKPWRNVDDEENSSGDHGGNTEFLQETTAQNQSDVSLEYVLETLPRVSLYAGIERAFAASSQSNQICYHAERIRVCRKVEAIESTYTF